MIWFISDTHFFHEKIIKYSNRPFKDIEEMHKSIIDNYNALVTEKDDVYFIGDISFERGKELTETSNIIKSLNGRKHLIYGNHDKPHREKYKELFLTCNDYLEIKYDKKLIVMCHYPITSWNKARYGSWHTHGHTHGEMTKANEVFIKDGLNRWDAGVDVNNFKPISFEWLTKKFNVEKS